MLGDVLSLYRDRSTADQCLKHEWIAEPAKDGAAKIGTNRLKTFKARRKWMVSQQKDLIEADFE